MELYIAKKIYIYIYTFKNHKSTTRSNSQFWNPKYINFVNCTNFGIIVGSKVEKKNMSNVYDVLQYWMILNSFEYWTYSLRIQLIMQQSFVEMWIYTLMKSFKIKFHGSNGSFMTLNVTLTTQFRHLQQHYDVHPYIYLKLLILQHLFI